jgi:hypothetical protein
VNLHYANQSVLYSTQFIASMGDEEVILDCGSIVTAAGNDQPSLPIHTRLALPWSAVERLHGLLGELIQSRAANPPSANPPSANPPGESPRATLPPLSLPVTPTPHQRGAPQQGAAPQQGGQSQSRVGSAEDRLDHPSPATSIQPQPFLPTSLLRQSGD